MNTQESIVEEQVAEAVIAYQALTTGHAPQSATVVLDEDTLVVTLHDALTLAEKALSRSANGAAQVQEFHRQLFANSSGPLRDEITRITGRQVREVKAELEPATGSVVQVFTTGALVQVFQLAPEANSR